MRRPTKLTFKPLSLKETAKALGIPRGRAEQVLAIVGVEPDWTTKPGRRRKNKVSRRFSSKTKF